MRTWLMLDSKWLAAHAQLQPPRGRFSFRAVTPRTWIEPVLRADKPWELMGLGSHTLLHDGGRYRLWYECRDENRRLCYAESDDLICWRKPNLGLLEYRGSRQNNILVDSTSGPGQEVHGHSIFVDPAAPAARRYRMIYNGRDGAQAGILTAHSSDGLDWRIATKAVSRHPNDTQIVACWDPDRRTYVGFLGAVEQDTRANPGRPVRCIARAETADFDRWPPPVIVRVPDEADGAETDFQNPCACRLESGDDVAWLMFPSTVHRDRGTCDVKLFTSRDGETWQRFDRRTIIAGGKDARDAGKVCAGPSLVPWKNGLALSYHSRRGIGLVEYARDRFQGLATEDLEATLCSFELAGAPIDARVNATVETGGEIRGALTQDGIVLPGCGFEDCRPVVGDVLEGALQWTRSARWTGRIGQRVELRLQIRKAVLYAITVAG